MILAIDIFLTIILLFMIIFTIKIITEAIKLRRNPVPRMQNHDKRFSEISNKYLHEMYSIKLR